MEECPLFAQRLTDARNQRGETQAQAAQHIGISAATLSILERRGNLATSRFSDIVAICDYYGWGLEEVAALCLEERALAEPLPAGLCLMLRGLPAEQKPFIFQAIETLVRGLGG